MVAHFSILQILGPRNAVLGLWFSISIGGAVTKKLKNTFFISKCAIVFRCYQIVFLIFIKGVNNSAGHCISILDFRRDLCPHKCPIMLKILVPTLNPHNVNFYV